MVRAHIPLVGSYLVSNHNFVLLSLSLGDWFVFSIAPFGKLVNQKEDAAEAASSHFYSVFSSGSGRGTAFTDFLLLSLRRVSTAAAITMAQRTR